MVRSTLRIRAQMWKVARPDRGFQNRPKSWTSDIYLLLDFFPVMNFHLEEIKRRSLAQFWCPDLSNQERNPKAKIGSCIAMEAEILEINVSMQKSSRMEILSSDSDSSHQKALDFKIYIRNSFNFWKIVFFRKVRKSRKNSNSINGILEFKKANFPFRRLCRTISLTMQRGMHTEFQMVRSTLRGQPFT